MYSMYNRVLVITIHFVLAVSKPQFYNNVASIRSNYATCPSVDAHITTGTWYVIEMSHVKPGVLTWLPWKHPQSQVEYYLHYIADPQILKGFEKEGDMHIKGLWRFLPSLEFPGWFKMQNGQFSDLFVTWRTIQMGNNEHAYFVLGKREQEMDYMIKPVFVKVQNGTNYYQLALLKFPEGVAYCSDRNPFYSHIENSLFPQVSSYGMCFPAENFYETTLFAFKKANASLINGDCEPQTSGIGAANALCTTLCVLSTTLHIF